MTRSLCSAIKLTGILLISLMVGFEALARGIEIGTRQENQNPVADLISIPLQNNTNFGMAEPSDTERAERAARDSHQSQQ